MVSNFEMMRYTYTSKSNLIAKLVEAANAQLGVTDIVIFGKAKSAYKLVLLVNSCWKTNPLHAPVDVSMIAFEVSTLPKRAA